MGERLILGGVPGYAATPRTGDPRAAVIVIQEWWGLDKQTESIADRVASEGYFAFAPDLFHGEAARLGDSARAMELIQKYGRTADQDLARAYDTLSARPGSDGKVASMGFCFGGRMSLALGLLRPLNAVITFYGGQMQTLFDKMGQWTIPVLGFFGDADVSIPAGTIEAFRQLLVSRGVEHEVYVYPQSGHAFFRDSDPSAYRPEAAKDAWERSKAFLKRHLTA